MRLRELGAHAPALGHVGHDPADLDRPVGPPASRGTIVHPARDPVGAVQPVLDVGILSGGKRCVERVVRGTIGRMERRLPVLHLRVRLGPAEQPVRARPLEELLDPAVGEHLGEVDVLADHVEQAFEALVRLRQSRSRLLPPRDVREDAADQHAAVRPAQWSRPVLDHPGDAVHADHAVLDLRVLTAQQPAIELRIPLPVVAMDPRLPVLARGDAVRDRAAEEARAHRRRRAVDVVAVQRDLSRVDLLLEEVEDAGGLRIDEPGARRRGGRAGAGRGSAAAGLHCVGEQALEPLPQYRHQPTPSVSARRPDRAAGHAFIMPLRRSG